MTPWLAAVLALVLAFAIPVAAACRGGTMARLAALPLAAAMASLILASMSFAFDQASYIDLALTLVILSLPGTLAMAMFVERWL